MFTVNRSVASTVALFSKVSLLRFSRNLLVLST
jgi:hypothetical protein